MPSHASGVDILAKPISRTSVQSAPTLFAISTFLPSPNTNSLTPSISLSRVILRALSASATSS